MPDATPAARAAYPTEDRRLKALGFALLALAVPAFYWLDAHRPAIAWPPASDEAWQFAIVAVLASNLVALGLVGLSAGFGHDRSLRDRRSRRAIGLKLLAANVLVPAVIYAVIADDDSIAQRIAESGWQTPVSAVLLGLGIFAFAFLRRGWRHEASSADEALARDPRPPVLYLRSFADDDEGVLDDYGFRLFHAFFRAIAWRSPEQELSALLSRIGPVLAIGKPGEPLPRLGAARLYVEDARWQHTVGDLMQRAALVVLRVGASPGVAWEIDQALRRLPRERLLLVLIGGSPLAEPIAQRLAPVLGPLMPAAMPVARRNRFLALVWPDVRRRLGSIVSFSPEGTPRVQPIQPPLAAWRERSTWRGLLYAAMLRPAAGPLRAAIEPVIQALTPGQATREDTRSRVVAVTLALLLGGIGAHWFYLGQRRRGWIRVLCCPAIAITIPWAWIEAIGLMWMDRTGFDQRYG